MISINFFEKKKTNMLPYIVGGTFLLLLFLMALYFFFTRMSYEHTAEEKNEWIEMHTEEVSLSRQISQIDQLIKQSETVQKTINENQYPMHIISEDISSAIPDEVNRVASFQLDQASQINLTLDNTRAARGQTVVEDLEELPYVTGVQFLNATSQNDEDNQLQFELIVDLNETAIVEEETE